MSFEPVDLLDVENLSENARGRAWERVQEGITRAHRRRNATRLTAGLAVAVAGGIAYQGLTPTSAYASWTAIPQPASISPQDPRVQSCERSLPVGPAESVGRSQRLTPVVVESRGDFTAALLGAGDSMAVCIFDDLNRMSGRTLAAQLPSGELASVVGNGGSLDEGDGARYVYGRVATAVDSIRVATADGQHVTASVSGGYYLAWWPSSEEPRTITALDRGGKVLQEVTPS